MKKRILWSRILYIISLVAMLVGFIDPLEGAFIILPASALLAFGAYLGTSRYRILSYWAFGLILVGVAVMVFLSSLGGLGGNTGRSMWWGADSSSLPCWSDPGFRHRCNHACRIHPKTSRQLMHCF
jgi:hypothetical protein